MVQRRRTESVLRCQAAALLKSKEEEASIFSKEAEDAIPKFEPRELREGIFLGSGGFCTVTEVQSVEVKDENDGSEKHCSSPLPSRQQMSRNNSFMHVQDREFISNNFLRQGQARYAVKKLSRGLFKQPEEHFTAGVLDLAMEVKFLSILQHPHIIKMRAISSTHPCSDQFFIVLDRLYETLTERIGIWKTATKKLKGLRDVMGHRKEEEFAKRMMVAHDICAALGFLHSNRVVYRDLKPDNIGFDIRDDVKIFDFGLAKELSENLRYKNTNTYKLTGETGSPRYMAPEIANRKPYNEKADIYSMALLLWQICELKVPYDDFDMYLLTRNVFHGSERPPINPKRPAGLQELFRKAWHTKSEKRPQCEEMMASMRNEIDGSAEESWLDITNRSEKSIAAGRSNT